MPAFVALLRGINVGGNCKLPMKELAGLFAGAGASGVRTYIQSGNVVFQADSDTSAQAVVAQVTAEIVREYGYTGRIVLRSPEQFAAVLEHNPFLHGAEPRDQAGLHVAFLQHAPEPELMAGLAGDAFAPDLFQLVGQEIYLFLPNGMARTKLTNAYFDSRLKVMSTVRNWKTVQALHAMQAGFQ